MPSSLLHTDSEVVFFSSEPASEGLTSGLADYQLFICEFVSSLFTKKSKSLACREEHIQCTEWLIM